MMTTPNSRGFLPQLQELLPDEEAQRAACQARSRASRTEASASIAAA